MTVAPRARPLDAVVVEVTGDHPALAEAELRAIFEVVQGEGLEAIGPLTFRGRLPRGGAEEIARRGGLLRYVGVELARAASPEAIEPGALTVKGTYAVRASLLEGAPEGLRSADLERALGARVKGGRVDLLAPHHVFRVFVAAQTHFTHEVYDRSADDFEERAVKHRPYFQPISLHPKFARALVNLTQVHDGQHLLDPFCGTGGILIEAALVGAHPVGIDVEPEAARGAALNLEHFGVLGTPVHAGRARDARTIVGGEVAAIATDPPYGRSATTLKMGPRAVIEESAPGLAEVLRPGGRVALCVPDLSLTEPLEDFFVRELAIAQRVHASLTRNYVVLQRKP
jgi:tRNA (guanine10-N2)-dimethyltransferase